MVYYNVERQCVEFGRVWRSNVHECPRRSKIALRRACAFECALSCFTCSFEFKLMGEVSKTYTRLFRVETSVQYSPSTTIGVLEEDLTCGLKLPTQSQTTKAINTLLTCLQPVNVSHWSTLRCGKLSPQYNLLRSKWWSAITASHFV